MSFCPWVTLRHGWQSNLLAACVRMLELSFVVWCSIAFLFWGLVESGFHSLAECKSAHTQTGACTHALTHAHTKRKHRTCGQRVLHNTVACPGPCIMHEEHVNTLFRACINDHVETRGLSTEAIKKRWCAHKGPHAPVSSTPTTTWSADTHFMAILNLVLFLCSWKRAE